MSWKNLTKQKSNCILLNCNLSGNQRWKERKRGRKKEGGRKGWWGEGGRKTEKEEKARTSPMFFQLLLGVSMQMKNCPLVQVTCVRFWQSQASNKTQLWTTGCRLLPAPEVQEWTDNLLTVKPPGGQQVFQVLTHNHSLHLLICWVWHATIVVSSAFTNLSSFPPLFPFIGENKPKMGTHLFPNTPVTKKEHVLSMFKPFSKKRYYATVKMLSSVIGRKKAKIII